MAPSEGSINLLAFEDDWVPARRLATAARVPLIGLEAHHFPDGETLVTLARPAAETTWIFRGLQDPDAKLFPLLLAANAARRSGARHVVLVAPYLPYMRQDDTFAPGQCVSAEVLGQLLGTAFDQICTVDPHLHRLASLDAVFGPGKGLAISAAPAITKLLRLRISDAYLIGPDEESRQWVTQIADGSFPYQIAVKQRRSDFHVSVSLPRPEELNDRRVVIVDDVASSGRTLAECAKAALGAGARSVECIVTHPIFAGNALEVIEDTRVRNVWSSDTIQHKTNRIEMAPMLAAALGR